MFGVPDRSQANLSLDFFLCSHQFSTWTHPSSSQVSCDLANMSFPCLSAVSGLSYCPGGELWLGAEGTAFIPVLTCLQGWREERAVQSAIILEGWSLHPGAFWVGVRMLRNTNICLPRKGWFFGFWFFICFLQILVPLRAAGDGGARGLSFLPFCPLE